MCSSNSKNEPGAVLPSRRRAAARRSPCGKFLLLPALAACLLAAAGPLLAQADIEQALRLARDGQGDQAEEICQKALKDTRSTPEVRAAVDWVRSELLLARSARDKDLESFTRSIDESVELLKKFSRSELTAGYTQAARRGMDERLLKKADRLSREVRGAEASPRRAELLKQADALYTEIDRHFRGRLEELRRLKAKGGQEDEEQEKLDAELLEVLLDAPRANLDHARLPGVDASVRKQVLQAAIDALQDFQFDYSDSAVSFEALWLEGKCQEDLGDVQAAQDRYTGALSLKGRLAEAKKQPTEYHRGLLSSVVISLSELLLKAGRPADAGAAVDQALQDDDQLAGTLAGWALKLQKAEALFQSDDIAGAQALASEIIDKAEGGIVQAAKDRVRLWSGDSKGGGLKGTPEKALLSAISLIENEEWLAAIKVCRQCLDQSISDEEKERYSADALYKMGQSFMALGRNQEAALNFQRIIDGFSGHELAPRACFEAVRALAAEFGATADPAVDQLQEKFLATLLQKWPNHPAARNISYLQAERLEKAGQPDRAAALYLKVPDDADARDNALIAASRCFYQQAASAGEKKGQEGPERERVRGILARAEETLQDFFTRAADPRHSPKSSELVKARAASHFIAIQQLALIDSHPAMEKHRECIQALDQYLKTLSPRDGKNARILAIKARSLLALQEVPQALAIIEDLIARFPDSAALGAVCKSAAIQLQRSLEGAQAPREAGEVQEKLRTIHRYYRRWFNDGAARGARFSAPDCIAVGETLLLHAKLLNGLAESSTHLDTPPEKVIQPMYFKETAAFFGLLSEGKAAPLADKDRLGIFAGWARSESFIAADAAAWERIRDRYQAAVKLFKIVDENNQLDRAAMAPNPKLLLAAYFELGQAQLQLARKGQTALFEEAITMFQNVLGEAPDRSEMWWLCKYLVLASLADRGTPSDLQLARVLLGNVEKNDPDFDGDKFNIKTRLLAIKERLSAAQ